MPLARRCPSRDGAPRYDWGPRNTTCRPHRRGRRRSSGARNRGCAQRGPESYLGQTKFAGQSVMILASNFPFSSEFRWPLMTSPNRQKSFAHRFRLVIRNEHQFAIAIIILCCLVGMCSYFWYRSVLTQGTIDIDRAQPLQADFRVDINSADWSEIVVLPGVGEKLARAIVECRQTHGPFDTLEEIQQVRGIGEKKLQKLKPFLLPIQ